MKISSVNRIRLMSFIVIVKATIIAIIQVIVQVIVQVIAITRKIVMIIVKVIEDSKTMTYQFFTLPMRL